MASGDKTQRRAVCPGASAFAIGIKAKSTAARVTHPSIHDVARLICCPPTFNCTTGVTSLRTWASAHRDLDRYNTKIEQDGSLSERDYLAFMYAQARDQDASERIALLRARIAQNGRVAA